MAPATVDEYLADFDDDVREILQGVRDAIHAALPDAEERIRYGMPAVMLSGNRYAIHFAGWKKHVGLYPVTTLPDALEAEVAPYRTAKDTVRFFYAEPVPYDLITRVSAALGQLRGSPAAG